MRKNQAFRAHLRLCQKASQRRQTAYVPALVQCGKFRDAAYPSCSQCHLIKSCRRSFCTKEGFDSP